MAKGGRIMQISHATEARPYAESLPVYDEFPYLLTRLAPALYHVIPLLDVFDESSLKSIARYQTQCNHLPTWLVLARNRYSISASPAGKRARADHHAAELLLPAG
jgi:hypothetical protein